MDNAALARQLAEWRVKDAASTNLGARMWARGAYHDLCHEHANLILRALCVMAAVEERNNMICRAACMFTGNYLSQRADELLAEWRSRR